MINGSTQQESITILNVYVTKNRVNKLTKLYKNSTIIMEILITLPLKLMKQETKIICQGVFYLNIFNFT